MGIFVAQPDAMHHHRIAMGAISLGQAFGFLGQFAQMHAGFEERPVFIDMLAGDREKVALGAAGRPFAAQSGARNIGAIAIGADQIGVEGDQIAGMDLAAAAFLEPGIGARARS